MAYISPDDFVRMYNGKAIDNDKAFGVQCVDGFTVWCDKVLGHHWPTKTNYAEGYWLYRNEHADDFDFITDASKLQNGDWVIWRKDGRNPCPESHIAMYYNGQFFGQRQGTSDRSFCLRSISTNKIWGALRWKGYERKVTVSMKEGYQILSINGHTYTVYKQRDGEKAGLLSAGKNNTQDFKELVKNSSMNVWVYAQVANGNFYQLSGKNADPYGTTYGAMVDPSKGVYVIMPSQKNNLYYDLDTGEYGSVENYYPDKTHNVFSPALVFHDNTYEYAPMVGIHHADFKSTFTGVLKCNDDRYAFILGKAGRTPREMWNDFRTMGKNLAILDGDASAQMGCWDGKQFIYPRYTGRYIASEIVFYKLKSDTTAGNKQQSQIDQLKEKNQTLETEKDDLQTKNDSIQKEKTDLQSQADELKKQNEELQSSNADLLKQIEDLKAQVAEYRATLDKIRGLTN